MAQRSVAFPGCSLPPRRLQTDPHYHLRTTLPLSRHLTPSPPSSPTFSQNSLSNLPDNTADPSAQLYDGYSSPYTANPFSQSSDTKVLDYQDNFTMGSSRRNPTKGTQATPSRMPSTTRKTQAKAARYCTMDSPYTQQTWNWIHEHQNMPSRLRMSTGYDFTFPTASYYDRNNTPFMPDSDLLKVDPQEEFAWSNGLPLFPTTASIVADNDRNGESFQNARPITPLAWQDDDDQDWYLRPSRFELENGFNFNDPPAMPIASSSPIMPLMQPEPVQRSKIHQSDPYSEQQSGHEVLAQGSYGAINSRHSAGFRNAGSMSPSFHPASQANMSMPTMRFPNHHHHHNNDMMRQAPQATFNPQDFNFATSANNMMRRVHQPMPVERENTNGQEFGQQNLIAGANAGILAVFPAPATTESFMDVSSVGEPLSSEDWPEGFDLIAAFANGSAGDMDLDAAPANLHNTQQSVQRSLPVDLERLDDALYAIAATQNDGDIDYLFDAPVLATSTISSPLLSRVLTLTNTGTTSSSLQTPVDDTPAEYDALTTLKVASTDWNELFADIEEDNNKFLEDFATMS